MRVQEKTLARIYSFDLQFKGGNRTQFYRKLFGFKSKISREDKEGREKIYENFYPGLLTPLPHLRLGKSVIAVPKIARDELDKFFEDPKWGDIDLYTFDGILPSRDRSDAMREALDRIKVNRGVSLDSEIKSLKSLTSKASIDSKVKQRVEIVLERCEELMDYDWTDNSQFSSDLEMRLDPLNNQFR